MKAKMKSDRHLTVTVNTCPDEMKEEEKDAHKQEDGRMQDTCV